MKIEKAIETLQLTIKTLPGTLEEEEIDAIKLGVEALFRLKNHRNEHIDITFRALPGETNDAEDKAPLELQTCTAENPCCDRRGEYNGFDSGPIIFTCPQHCSCHD